MEKNYRSRWHCLLLYPDSEEHMTVLKTIKESYSDYAYILHDMDADENGEIKKLHYHVVIKLQNAIWRTAISKELNLKENYIQQCRNPVNALEYLIHFNDNTKHQYEIDSVIGPLKQKLIREVNKDDKTECERAIEVLEHINETHNEISVSALSVWCANNGYWDIYRRSAIIMMKCIDEHNERYKRERT